MRWVVPFSLLALQRLDLHLGRRRLPPKGVERPDFLLEGLVGFSENFEVRVLLLERFEPSDELAVLLLERTEVGDLT